MWPNHAIICVHVAALRHLAAALHLSPASPHAQHPPALRPPSPLQPQACLTFMPISPLFINHCTPFADQASLTFMPIPATSGFAGYFKRDISRTTPFPQPIDLMMGWRGFTQRAHATIPGILVRGLWGNWLDWQRVTAGLGTAC